MAATKSIRRPVAKKSIAERIDAVIIPGTTGGFYTTLPGAMLLLSTLGVSIHSYLTGRNVPTIFSDLLLSGVGLLGVHSARAALTSRNTTDTARDAIDSLEKDESVTVKTPEGTIEATKTDENSDSQKDFIRLRDSIKG